MSIKGAQFLYLACQGGRLPPLPSASYATDYNTMKTADEQTFLVTIKYHWHGINDWSNARI